MNQNSKLKDFLARFFPTFLCTYFLSCLAVGCTLSLVWSTYLLSADIRSFLMTTAIVTVIVTGGHIAVVRGRPWGLWVVVGVFLACLFIVLPTYGYRPHPFSYTTGICSRCLDSLFSIASATAKCVSACSRSAKSAPGIVKHVRPKPAVERAAKQRQRAKA